MRRGEIENCLECVGPSSCIFPIAREAVHREPGGLARGGQVVHRLPRGVAARPAGHLAPEHRLHDAGRVSRKGPAAIPDPGSSCSAPKPTWAGSRTWRRGSGWASRGPNLAGGSIFDDFNGDGLPDLFTTSLDADLGASLFVNRGDGTFEDRSASAGLGDQVYALNVTRADFDNDGDLDVLLLRGAWETPLRLSLLRNKGDGVFDDVTVASGLAEPIATESAAWGDYDNDGLGRRVRLRRVPPSRRCPVVDARATRATAAGSTTTTATARSRTSPPRPASPTSGAPRGRPGATTTATAGSTSSSRTWARRAVFTTTRATARSATSPPSSASPAPTSASPAGSGTTTTTACLDLYVNDYRARVAEVLCSAMGMKIEGSSRPRLYRNLGSDGFRDVSSEVGLDRAMAPMGANFGDIDNDGYLDIYLGTGDMSYEGLDVNLMFKNVEGRRFEDVTDVLRHRPPSEGARRLVRRLGLRRRPRPVRRARRRDARRPGVQRPVSEPGPRPPLAEGQAGRHQDQPRGPRGQDPGRSEIDRRPDALDPSHGRQQLQLRRQQPRRDDRPARRDTRRRADRLLADEPDDPDLPRPRRRPGDRDHRGFHLLQSPSRATAFTPRY